MKPVRYDTRGTGRRAVSATDAARNFGRIVDQVRETQVEFIVERGGVGVVKIAPVASQTFRGGDLVQLMKAVSGADEGLAREVEGGRARTNRPAVPRDPWAS